jgi:putative transposase
VKIIQEAVSLGARLSKACETTCINPSTYRRWQSKGIVQRDKRPHASRPTPSNKLGKAEREQILAVCSWPKYSSLPPSQIVPDLADNGVYLGSESSYYRVLHEANQQHDRGRSQSKHQRAKPAEYETTGPNQCWSWDVTWLKSPVRGLFYYLYMIVDIFSRKIVGWEVHENECATLASELVRRTVLSEGGVSPEVLHADNGAIQRSSTLRVTLERLGIEPRYSRPRVSNDNAYSESLFRTLKYRPAYPVEGFPGIVQAREWTLEFTVWYNSVHKHSALKFVTPEQRHTGQDVELLLQRKALYEKAKLQNPERWSGNTRDWVRTETVVLNPDEPMTRKQQN